MTFKLKDGLQQNDGIVIDSEANVTSRQYYLGVDTEIDEPVPQGVVYISADGGIGTQQFSYTRSGTTYSPNSVRAFASRAANVARTEWDLTTGKLKGNYLGESRTQLLLKGYALGESPWALYGCKTTTNIENPAASYSVFSSVANTTKIVPNGGVSAATASQYGEVEYPIAGTYSWVVPAGITSVSAIAVGGGGAGNAGSTYNGGGGGGALRYINSMSVTPGETLTIVVGAGGAATASNVSSAGGESSISRGATKLLFAGGGAAAAAAAVTGGLGATAGSTVGGSIGGGNGGNGGNGNSATGAGGGGAGGYSGVGGVGGNALAAGAAPTSGSGGGGGGGSDDGYGQGGGGVGLYGLGTDGAAGAYNSVVNTAGMGGSGGGNGGMFRNDANKGGMYGGGGGGMDAAWAANNSNGGGGAVRIIWKTSGANDRSFPSTNVTSNGTHYVHYTQGASLAASTYYTLSGFFRASGYTNVTLMIPANGTTFTSNVSARFNVATGTVVSSSNVSDVYIRNYGGGWYRAVIVTNLTSAAGNVYPRIYISPDNTTDVYVADGTSGVLSQVVQLEQGRFASSPISNSNAPYTVGADMTTINGNLLTTNGAISLNEGTFFITAYKQDKAYYSPITKTYSGSAVPKLIEMTDGTNNNRISVMSGTIEDGNENSITIAVIVGGIEIGSAYVNGILPNQLFKVAISYSANGVKWSFNGQGGTVSTSKPTMTSVALGSQGTQNQGWWNSHIGNFVYYKKALSQSQLNKLTS